MPRLLTPQRPFLLTLVGVGVAVEEVRVELGLVVVVRDVDDGGPVVGTDEELDVAVEL